MMDSSSNQYKVEKRYTEEVHDVHSQNDIPSVDGFSFCADNSQPDGGGDKSNRRDTTGKVAKLWDSLDAKYMAGDASSKKFPVKNKAQSTLKHKKEDFKLLFEMVRIEESLIVDKDSDKPKSKNVTGPSVVNMDDDVACDLYDLHATSSLGNKKYFVKFIDDASREAWNAVFVRYVGAFRIAFRFSSVPRPSLRIPNGTEDIGGSVVPEEVIEKAVQQPEPKLRNSKRNRTPKNFGPEFQLITFLI
ncbi:hypothetical protein Tco_0026055 [Tanacetum coccineum]